MKGAAWRPADHDSDITRLTEDGPDFKRRWPGCGLNLDPHDQQDVATFERLRTAILDHPNVRLWYVQEATRESYMAFVPHLVFEGANLENPGAVYRIAEGTKTTGKTVGLFRFHDGADYPRHALHAAFLNPPASKGATT